MIKEVAKVAKTNRSKAVQIYNLMNWGRIRKIVNEHGRLCYDTEEYKAYRKNPRRIGRPPKSATPISEVKNEKPE